jgi:hypothetical protein
MGHAHITLPVEQVEQRGGSAIRLKMLLLGLVASVSLGWAGPAAAFYQRYVTNASWVAGSIAGSMWNGLTYNATQFDSCCGGTPYMGTSYQRTDGTQYSFLWSNTGSIFDSRTIAYGEALCEANPANRYRVYVSFCDTGNT